MRHVLTETSSCHGNNQNLKLLSGRKIKESNKGERETGMSMTCQGKRTQAIKIEGGSHTFRSRPLISKPTSFTRHCVGDKSQSTGKPQHSYTKQQPELAET